MENQIVNPQENDDPPRLNLRAIAQSIRQGTRSAESVAQTALDRAQDSQGVFVEVNERIVEEAAAIDRLLARGGAVGALSGALISIKDLFDVKGQLTRAGSILVEQVNGIAEQDCDVVASLRAAGLLFIGRTTMSEFAFSGMGLNPHYGQCHSIWDRETRRLPGGSSSGSAVSVAEGIVPATMGSDTAGSCRIPAAFNGIVGVKPSFGRLSLKGVFPLSPTSDAPGPLGIDLDSCYLLDRAMVSPQTVAHSLPSLGGGEQQSIVGMRLWVPESIVLDGLDETVSRGFARSLDWLQEAGAILLRKPFDVIDRCVNMFQTRAVVLYEAYQAHAQWLEQYPDLYDPFVLGRISNGRGISEQEQQKRYQDKQQIVADFNAQFLQAGVDAIIYPTVSSVPPTVSSAEDPDRVAQINLGCLRNTSSANYFDGCSLTLPCHDVGEAPVGLMVSAVHGQDDKLYGVGFAIESVLNANRC